MASGMRWFALGTRMLLGAVALALVALARPATAGPFGFEMGMTVEQVKALVKLEPTETKGAFLARSAPKPHSAFQAYALIFSPKTGLAKVGAIGKKVTVAGTGLDLRSAFDAMEKSLSAKYGMGAHIDRLDPESVWSAPGYWMTALLKEERVLAARWDDQEKKLPDEITYILLQAKALTSSEGCLVLSYEFSNFVELKEAENKAL